MAETNRALAKRMVKSSSVYAVSGMLRNLVGFLMLPIYTRFLTPADYGVVELMLFVVSLIEISLGARLGHATAKYYHDQPDEDGRKAVVSTALVVTSLVSLLMTIIIATNSRLVSDVVYGNTDYATIVCLFSVLILTQAIETTGLDLVRIQNKVWWYFRYSLSKLIVQLTLNIVFVVVLEMGVIGVALASAISAVMMSIITLIYTLHQTGVNFDWLKAKLMFKFCIPIWISGIASLYIGSSNRYFMRIFVNLDEIGYYSLAQKLASIIAVLLWQPFFKYWSIERFRIKDFDNAIQIQNNVFLGISALLLMAGLGLSIFAPQIIWLLASDAFQSSHAGVPFLVAASIFYSLTSFFNFSFEHMEKTSRLTTISFIIVALVTVFYVSLIPVWGFVGAAAGLMLAQTCRFFISQIFAKRVYDLKLPVARFVMAFLAAAIGVAVTQSIGIKPISILSISVGAACYIISCAVILHICIGKDNIWRFIKEIPTERFSLLKKLDTSK